MVEMFIIKEFGFTKIEIEAIENFFSCSLNYDDWESMQIIDEVQEDDDNLLNLPTGRIVWFPKELVRKELISQID